MKNLEVQYGTVINHVGKDVRFICVDFCGIFLDKDKDYDERISSDIFKIGK